MRQVLRMAKMAVLATALVGCGASGAGARDPNVSAVKGPVNPAPISDADFAPSTYQVLLSGERNQKRLDLLAGVVRHQLDRSRKRFAAGNKTAGLDALTGALYLLRAGELRDAMVEERAAALDAGATEVARVGDEGRAMALYTMLRTVVKTGDKRADVDKHLRALARWSATTGNAGPMQALGDRQRAATNRSLLEPSNDALKKARETTVQWVSRALEFNAADGPIRSNFEREEAVEAYRAVRAGGATLVALYLRHGDASGALTALKDSDLVRVVPPGLTERLEHAARDDDPAAWADLHQLFDASNQMENPETSLDSQLARAAAWGAAVELFRSEPQSMRGAAPIAAELLRYGMAEVAPLTIAPALGAEPTVQELAWSLALVLRAIVDEEAVPDLASARRTFANAKPIVEIASSKNYVGRLRPSAGRLYYVMGALETRSGELGRALPLLERAVELEPSQEAYGLLAAILRQRGDATRALDSLDRLVSAAGRTGDRTAAAEALLSQFEIYRDQKRSQEATNALQQALRTALDARQQAKNGSEQARAERVLARALEHFDAKQGARRATERAYEAARSDVRQLTATVLDASRRALTQGDLAGARQAVRQATEAGLEDEDLVYVALWLKLVESYLGVPGDGTAEEALSSIDDDSGWPATLSAWGRGRLGDKELVHAARTRVQRTEAEFYVAMSKRKKPSPPLTALEKIATSEAIELVEVTIARDLVAREKSNLDLTLPPGVRVP